MLSYVSVSPPKYQLLETHADPLAHGDTQGSLLHEGSAVGPDGGKLVIRTDLLYEAKGFGQFKPPASVGVKQGGKEEEGLGG